MNFLRLGSTVTLSCALFLLLPSRARASSAAARPSGTAFIQKTKRSAASPFITRSVRPVTAYQLTAANLLRRSRVALFFELERAHARDLFDRIRKNDAQTNPGVSLVSRMRTFSRLCSAGTNFRQAKRSCTAVENAQGDSLRVGKTD